MRAVLMPHTLDHLWEFLKESPQATLYAGGTDLLVALRKGRIKADRLICLERMGELKGIRVFHKAVRIGACATHQELLSPPGCDSRIPPAEKSPRGSGISSHPTHGNHRGQHLHRVSGGRHSLPALYLFRAEVEIASARKTRRMPILDFISGPGITALPAQGGGDGRLASKGPGIQHPAF